MEKNAIASLLDLAGSSVLVTGASGNIGRGIAMRLAEAGAYVIAHAGSGLSRAQQVVQEITDRGGTAAAVKADVTSVDEVEKLIGELNKFDTPPSMIVNNAGLQPVSEFQQLSADEWSRVFDANLRSVFLLTRGVFENALKVGRKDCAAVNIASIEGLDPAKGHSHYASSKAGLVMFTRAAALEYAGRGARVNSVSPGLINRDGLDEDWPEGVAAWREKAPLSRLGTAEDIANAVLFLLSPAAQWINGANLVVDGGMSTSNRW